MLHQKVESQCRSCCGFRPSLTDRPDDLLQPAVKCYQDKSYQVEGRGSRDLGAAWSFALYSSQWWSIE